MEHNVLTWFDNLRTSILEATGFSYKKENTNYNEEKTPPNSTQYQFFFIMWCTLNLSPTHNYTT